MRRLVLALALALCAASGAHAAPTRIVSLDYCADQYVLGLADRNQIAALSFGADNDDSYYRDRAIGLRLTRGSLEEVLALKPDLVVRTWGGGPEAEAVYTRFHIPVLSLSDAATFGEAREEMLRAAHAFGQDARGAAVAADMKARIAALSARDHGPRPRVLYLTAGGATAGKGVLMDEVIRLAGGVNEYRGAYWNVLPLEQLVQRPPPFVARGFFTAEQTKESAWSPAHNAGFRRALKSAHVIDLPTGAISCSAWFQLDAAEALARALAS
jgi:iron complex transport system substrate-binding protein